MSPEMDGRGTLLISTVHRGFIIVSCAVVFADGTIVSFDKTGLYVTQSKYN